MSEKENQGYEKIEKLLWACLVMQSSNDNTLKLLYIIMNILKELNSTDQLI